MITRYQKMRVVNFISIWQCLFILRKNAESRIGARLTDENFDGSMRIATREITPRTERLVGHKQCEVSHK